MNVSNKQLHAFALICVALSHADGDVDPRELAALQMALRDLGMSRTEAQAAVAAAVTEVSHHADRADRLLSASCKRIPAALRATMFETATHVVLADGRLGDAECLRLAALRAMLGLPEAAALGVVAAAANTCTRLECRITKAVMA